jgi:cysteine desulfurase
MTGRVYLDHNATSPLRPEARAAVLAALDACGNPSSVHACGRRARDVVETARGGVAALVGGSTERLVFTSGGTEANALAIWSVAGSATRLIVSAIEHEAVVNTTRATDLPVEAWPVDRQGRVDLDWLADRLARWSTAHGAPFVALMLANNETGVIQPVAEAAGLVHAVGGWMHVDAVQAAGKIAFDMAALGADTLALSAHKLGGPQGAGALLFADGVRLAPRQHGGGQERGLRAGTENVAAIAGFGAAAEAAQHDLTPSVMPAGAEPRAGTQQPQPAYAAGFRIGSAVRDDGVKAGSQAHWRDAAAERLREAGAVIAGEGAPRLPGTLCLAVPDFPSALQVMALDLAGVEVSAGAACSSGKVKPSGVLEAMGYGDLAAGALRASSGWSTTEDDWVRFADAWLEAHARRTRSQATRTKEYA